MCHQYICVAHIERADAKKFPALLARCRRSDPQVRAQWDVSNMEAHVLVPIDAHNDIIRLQLRARGTQGFTKVCLAMVLGFHW